MHNLRLLLRTHLQEALIKEARITDHFEQRLHQRLVGTNGVQVGYESSPMQYEIVGDYIIPQEIISDVADKMTILKNTRFPEQKDYGIKVTQIPIIPTKINFLSNHNLNTIKGKNLLFVSDGDESNGNVLYVVIRKNVIFTFMFMKSYIKIDALKLRVNHILSDWNIIKSNQVR